MVSNVGTSLVSYIFFFIEDNWMWNLIHEMSNIYARHIVKIKMNFVMNIMKNFNICWKL